MYTFKVQFISLLFYNKNMIYSSLCSLNECFRHSSNPALPWFYMCQISESLLYFMFDITLVFLLLKLMCFIHFCFQYSLVAFKSDWRMIVSVRISPVSYTHLFLSVHPIVVLISRYHSGMLTWCREFPPGFLAQGVLPNTLFPGSRQ